jgi:hypothetical protein
LVWNLARDRSDGQGMGSPELMVVSNVGDGSIAIVPRSRQHKRVYVDPRAIFFRLTMAINWVRVPSFATL